MSAPACPLCGIVETVPFVIAEDGRRYHRCPVCRLTFLDPVQRPDPQTERAVYAQHENDPDDPRYRAFLERLIGPLRPHLRPGMVGLDYGSGPGPAIAPILANAGIEVTNYDPFFAPDPAALARRYDLVTCSETVEHFHHPGLEFARLDALLRPGGWLGIMTGMLLDDEAFAGWWYRRDPTHVCFYRPATMCWIAGRFGWELRFAAANVILFQKPPAPALR